MRYNFERPTPTNRSKSKYQVRIFCIVWRKVCGFVTYAYRISILENSCLLCLKRRKSEYYLKTVFVQFVMVAVLFTHVKGFAYPELTEMEDVMLINMVNIMHIKSALLISIWICNKIAGLPPNSAEGPDLILWSGVICEVIKVIRHSSDTMYCIMRYERECIVNECIAWHMNEFIVTYNG